MKGQNLRMSIKVDGGAYKHIAGAITCDLQIDCDVNDCSSKDSDSGWKENESGLKSFSGSGQCQLVPDADKLVGAYGGWSISNLIGMKVLISFDETDPNSSMNRTTTTPRKKGWAIINSWKTSAQNGQTTMADFSFTGTGKLEDETPYITGADEVILTATNAAKSGTYVASDSQAITATKETSATWLTVTVNSNTVTFTPTAYAHAASGDDPRVARVTIATSTGASKVVLVKQPMAAS